MNEEISILDIVDMLLRKWIIIAISAVLVGVMAFVYSAFFVAPVYNSRASLYVNSSRDMATTNMTFNDMDVSRQLVMTYAEILQSRTFLEKIEADMHEKYTVKELGSMISFSALNETEILSISVSGTDADDVYKIAKSIVKYAPDEIIRIVEAGTVKVLDNASETKLPVSPNVGRNTFVGVFAGIILGALLIIVLELFDTRIKSASEISQRYEEPILGEIPSFTNKSSSYGYSKRREK